jgi:hypothetical protein
VALSDNTAQGGAGANGVGGGAGGNGGPASGGGLEVASGTVTLLLSTVTGNASLGGIGGTGSQLWLDEVALVGGVNSTTTTLHVNDIWAFAVGQTIRIGGEQMIVTGVDTVHSTLTVLRGANGTTAMTHYRLSSISLLYTGAAGSHGASQGGGVANDALALALWLDALTEADIVNNTAETDPNLHGPFTPHA